MRKDFDRPDTAARTSGTAVFDTFEGLYASGFLARLKRHNLALDRLRHALENELASPARGCAPRKRMQSTA